MSCIFCPHSQQQKSGIHQQTKVPFGCCGIQHYIPWNSGGVLPILVSGNGQIELGSICGLSSSNELAPVSLGPQSGIPWRTVT